MLVRQIPALEAVLKKQASPNKFCLCDHFLREAWLQERIPLDVGSLNNVPEATVTLAGHLIESVIGYYLTGISGLDISWFPERTQEPEVDFVITVGLSRIPLEVKYRHRPVNEQDLRGVRVSVLRRSTTLRSV